ncbi:MAG TPA: RIP metalloprotease RseP, partial [Thermodesulforhabdus norvegica]|nr:RIP metalloprotease RseP [Thermodesulforhabdus norvegica]
MGNKKEILETMMTIIYAIIVLGVLIFVHELGHFLVARWCGVHVERFSIGFGPPIFEWTRGETEYCIAAIPFGGYVKMLGEESLDEVNPSDYHRSFQYQSSGRRALIVAAGPLCNFLLALVLFFVVFVFSGIPTLLPEVGSVEPGSPAELAGFKSGDLIIQINERKITQWDNLSQAIK